LRAAYEGTVNRTAVLLQAHGRSWGQWCDLSTGQLPVRVHEEQCGNRSCNQKADTAEQRADTDDDESDQPGEQRRNEVGLDDVDARLDAVDRRQPALDDRDRREQRED